jgi:hypothetical protein
MKAAVSNALETLWTIFVLIMVAITIFAIVKREDMKREAVQEYRQIFHDKLSQVVAAKYPYAPQAWADAFTHEAVDCFTSQFAAQVQPKDFVINRITFGLADGNIERAATPSPETQRACADRGFTAAGNRAGEDLGRWFGALFE